MVLGWVCFFFSNNCEDEQLKVYWTESKKLNPDAAEFSRFSHMPCAFISRYKAETAMRIN